MLATERHRQILSLLEEKGTVRTLELAEALNVTDETIRRDIKALADAQLLTRIHGGASNASGRPKLRSFTERRALKVQQKTTIAAAAIEFIESGKTYAFDSSTTAFEVVTAMEDIPCRVITNAFPVIDHLIRMEQVELLSTGGRYHPKTQTFNGEDSIDAIRHHNIHTAFVSCIGLDPEKGASEGFEAQAGFKSTLVKMAEQVVILLDSEKLGQRSDYFFANMEQITHIITDKGAAPEIVDALRKRGCRITLA